jgi:rhodanese-related sulfurtransferase
VKTLTREQLKEKMDRGDDFVLVDALGEEYYRQSRLPGAINVPLEEIDRAEEVLPDKEAEIVFTA